MTLHELIKKLQELETVCGKDSTVIVDGANYTSDAIGAAPDIDPETGEYIVLVYGN